MRQLRSKTKAEYRSLMLSCLERADIKSGFISIKLSPKQTAASFDIESSRPDMNAIAFTSSFQLRKRGVKTKLIIGDVTKPNIDAVLIRNVALAHAVYEKLKSGNDIIAIAEEIGLSKRRVLQLIDHAFLSPQITKSILEGRQSIGLTTEWLQRNQVHTCWKEQKNMFVTL